MAKYIKKPVEIEAFQYDGDLKGSDGKYYVPDWAVQALENGTIYYDSLNGREEPCELFIRTLEGNHHVSVNDYVIKGVKGELYPCKPDIFEDTYETISENDNKIFKEKVEKFLLQGYKISSTNCGYAGEVGGNVYDCEYWMAILVKE